MVILNLIILIHHGTFFRCIKHFLYFFGTNLLAQDHAVCIFLFASWNTLKCRHSVAITKSYSYIHFFSDQVLELLAKWLKICILFSGKKMFFENKSISLVFWQQRVLFWENLYLSIYWQSFVDVHIDVQIVASQTYIYMLQSYEILCNLCQYHHSHQK